MSVGGIIKSPFLTAHIEINYEAGCIGRFSKSHRNISKIFATVKMEFFVALVSSFQPQTNFTKKPSKGAMGDLNAPLE